MEDDDRPARKPFAIGGPLDDVSVSEIDGRIEALSAEIERLRAARERKAGSIAAAHAFFKS